MPREIIVSHCKFINNDVDVYNESGRNFFMPGNYFYHERQSDGSHNYIETDSKNPGKDKKDNKNLVSAYPMMNEAFTEYIYGEDDVAVPNSGEESYMTPYSELPGMDIMVVETGGAEDVPCLALPSPTPQPAPTAARRAPRPRRTRGASTPRSATSARTQK